MNITRNFSILKNRAYKFSSWVLRIHQESEDLTASVPERTMSLPMTHSLIAVAAPIRSYFTYKIPEKLAYLLRPGHLVEVPFGRGSRRGVVVELDVEPPSGMEIREIASLVEKEIVLPAALIKTLRWAASYYLVAAGEMFFAALPPPMRRKGKSSSSKTTTLVRPTSAAAQGLQALQTKAPRQAQVLRQVLDKGNLELSCLAKLVPGARAAIRALQAKGLVKLEKQEIFREPDWTDLPSQEDVKKLTPDQHSCMEQIVKAIQTNTPDTFLLHGVTGSGKTEVYLRAMAAALKKGKSAILLVPEISLTPQLTQRVKAKFGDKVAVLHSGLTEGQRLDQWRTIQKGQTKVAVGARSAVFAPLENLGLIVVDEEHDSSYKQSERLPYNGRDLALVRAREEGAVAVLGSATPSLESYSRALDEKIHLLELNTRVQSRPLPSMEIVDLRNELDPMEREHVLSSQLAQALAQTLDAKEQAILFLNRRGYSSFAICQDCGQAVRCTNCSVALVHHLKDNQLRCHYCGITVNLPTTCKACGSKRVKPMGMGTEKCEIEVKRRFPGAKVLRIDSDTMAARGQLQHALSEFVSGRVDILVGTQMITKGHDIPGVTLVGVILADQGLHLPDFRASERTFQQLIQVAGRSGRGKAPGRVLVQTFLPSHQSIQLAKSHSYKEFMALELTRRQALGYAPAKRLMMIRISHTDANKARDLAQITGRVVRSAAAEGLQVLGPVTSPLAKIRNRYRWQLLIKSPGIESLHMLAGAVFQKVKIKAPGRILFDVDPLDML